MTAASDAPARIETATERDAGRLIALVAAFHGDAHPLTPPQREALRALLRDPRLGRAFILSGAAGDLGYATCLFAHSIDAGGRIAVLDDLYIAPSARGRSLGAWFLAEIEAELARSGVRAVSLHADRADARAVRLYRGRGFTESRLATFEKALERSV